MIILLLIALYLIMLVSGSFFALCRAPPWLAATLGGLTALAAMIYVLNC
jgi:hypothetical protein